MREDYKLNGPTVKLQVELEKPVAEILAKMEGFTKHSQSELVNTAVKRFISSHKDFLPAKSQSAVKV